MTIIHKPSVKMTVEFRNEFHPDHHDQCTRSELNV